LIWRSQSQIRNFKNKFIVNCSSTSFCSRLWTSDYVLSHALATQKYLAVGSLAQIILCRKIFLKLCTDYSLSSKIQAEQSVTKSEII
jgi:hypothetical protein